MMWTHEWIVVSWHVTLRCNFTVCYGKPPMCLFLGKSSNEQGITGLPAMGQGFAATVGKLFLIEAGLCSGTYWYMWRVGRVYEDIENFGPSKPPSLKLLIGGTYQWQISCEPYPGLITCFWFKNECIYIYVYMYLWHAIVSPMFRYSTMIDALRLHTRTQLNQVKKHSEIWKACSRLQSSTKRILPAAMGNEGVA